MADNQRKLVLTQAVNNLLHASDLPASLTIEQCAKQLAMSMTSFRRKLAQEDTSFKLIQQKFLNELSVQALLTKHANIDQLAIRLGYSERATFERAFRQKFGLTPSQFRSLSLQSDAQVSGQQIIEIAENLPPMPDSCQQLLKCDRQQLDLEKVMAIVSKDAIFAGRLMGQASKAIYGKTPKDLQEAIGRNLGINTVVNFAVIYALQDALQTQVPKNIIEQYSQAFMLAPKVFQQLRRVLPDNVNFDIARTEQVLVFALLGIFVLSHKNAYQHELTWHSLQGIDDITHLNQHLKATMGLSIFEASSVMLSLWHIDAGIVKALAKLDKATQSSGKVSQQIALVLFILSCLYVSAKGTFDYQALAEKAELLNLQQFEGIEQILNGVIAESIA